MDVQVFIAHWVPCSERLPAFGVSVLLAIVKPSDYEDVLIGALCSSHGKLWWSLDCYSETGGESAELRDVTHWMPRPDLPKEIAP